MLVAQLLLFLDVSLNSGCWAEAAYEIAFLPIHHPRMKTCVCSNISHSRALRFARGRWCRTCLTSVLKPKIIRIE